MLITNHVLAGTVVGVVSPNPATAFALGFVSHLVCDSLPHYGPSSENFLKVAVADGLFGAAVATTMIAIAPPQRRKRVAAGIFGACLPDTDKPNKLFFGQSYHPKWFQKIHFKVQREARKPMREVGYGALLSTGAMGLYTYYWDKDQKKLLS